MDDPLAQFLQAFVTGDVDLGGRDAGGRSPLEIARGAPRHAAALELSELAAKG